MILTEAKSAADKKRELREAAIARRDRMPPDDRVRAARKIAAGHFPIEVPKGAIVAGFSPINTEFNPIPLLRRFSDAGARLALPKVVGRGNPLRMREWKFGDPLVAGVWGIREPGPDAPEVDPDILLVPFAAFDRAGYRIGYGAGYYDMTLAALRAKKTIVAVGLGFATQEVDKVPVEAHDQRLDFILTEQGLLFTAGSA
ncbi:MAG TPA: 5-formyltetrahydrofolate cyclo-ligase [Xanthobacteraceae bacterium]|nr:5-formyltetrahydrofolate cyclo-ligase [Xanthobacteraceae bacterium]